MTYNDKLTLNHGDGTIETHLFFNIMSIRMSGYFWKYEK